MICGIHHIAINVANFDLMKTFYQEAFGFEVAGEELSWANDPITDASVGLSNSAARTVMLRAHNAFIEMFEYSSPSPNNSHPLLPSDRGYTHFSVDVKDIEFEFERLTKLGMTFLLPEPADFGIVKSAYGKDPEGNIIELQETSGSSPFELAKR